MTPSTRNTEGQRGCECDWSGYLCLNCIQGKPCACDGCRHSAPAEPMVSISLEAAEAALRALRHCSSPYKGGEWPKRHIQAISAAIASTQSTEGK